MTVGEYRKAAIRHFDTCKLLLRYLALPNTSNLKNLSEDEILKNIFYLTGYVAECAIKYRFLTNIHGFNDLDEEHQWKAVGVETRRHLTFVLPRDTKWAEETIQNLCAHTQPCPINLHLQNLANCPNASSLVSSIQQDMQASWEPGVRYHYAITGLPVPPDKTHVQMFFDETKSLLRNLSII